MLLVGLALVGGGASAVVQPAVASPSEPAAGPAQLAYDVTSAKERQRVDRVPTPKLDWRACHDGFTCATVRLPLDYDHPKGKTVEVAMLRHAAQTKDKIGTLFLNPGGPGESGTQFATYAPEFLPASILDRFDVVGFDPRGVGDSSALRCFRSADAQQQALAPIDEISFPDSPETARTYLRAGRKVAKACSGRGRPLATSMSAAQVARDLDVLRRAVGDDQLSYLGLSYGTYLGQVYANLFPDRVRALVLDGVFDPVAWQGSRASRNDPAWDRLRAAETSKHALDTLLLRCAEAGPSACDFAATGDPTKNFAVLAERLHSRPLVLDDGEGGSFEYGYDDLVGEVLDDLYAIQGAEDIDALLTDLWTLSSSSGSSTARQAAVRSVVAARRELVAREGVSDHRAADTYDSAFDTFVAVSCTDSVRLDKARQIPKAAARAERRVAYFGALWAWNTLGCAKDSFTARDEDSYRGSFRHTTRAPLLFVGDTYDPVTSLRAATKAAGLAGNSALVASDSWGHTAYNTSACVSDAVDAYLLTGRAPSARVTHCVGDYQPFSTAARSAARPVPLSTRLVASGRLGGGGG